MGMRLRESCQNKAVNALKLSNYNGRKGLSRALNIAQSTVSNFFLCIPIRPENFKKICDSLKLDPKEVSEDIDGLTKGEDTISTSERLARDRIKNKESLIRIVAPSGFGKSGLIGRLHDYTESLGHQNIYANLD
jgi:hypothetical protein